ncbi:MAG: low molecular weight protein-tyrosine-phosphatase [Bacteroidia bacterium]
MEPTKILFVCLGNICRSPMAEGLMLHLVNQAGVNDRFLIESAGTSSYHQGELPDKRMRETARQHGIDLTSRARQFRKRDLQEYDHIIAMDRSVLHDIQTMNTYGEAARAQVYLMRDHDPNPGSPDVPDPYYGGPDGFEEVYQILHRSNATLLQKLLNPQRD